jgi:hypothetical protein
MVCQDLIIPLVTNWKCRLKRKMSWLWWHMYIGQHLGGSSRRVMLSKPAWAYIVRLSQKNKNENKQQQQQPPKKEK